MDPGSTNGGYLHTKCIDPTRKSSGFYGPHGWAFSTNDTVSMTVHPKEKWIQFATDSYDVMLKGLEMDGTFRMAVAMGFKNACVHLTEYSAQLMVAEEAQGNGAVSQPSRYWFES